MGGRLELILVEKIMALGIVDALAQTIGFIGKEHGGHTDREHGVEQHKAGAVDAHHIHHQSKSDG